MSRGTKQIFDGLEQQFAREQSFTGRIPDANALSDGKFVRDGFAPAMNYTDLQGPMLDFAVDTDEVSAVQIRVGPALGE